MENEFKNILLILQKLNSGNINLSSNDLDQEYENLNDLEQLNKRALKTFTELQNIHHLSTDEILDQATTVDTQLSLYIWHIGSMRDMIEKFLYYERFKI